MDHELPTRDNSDLIVPEVVLNFGSLLRDLRLNHGYKLQQIANRTGLSPEAISSIEHNRKKIPEEDVLRTWLQYLGVGKENLKKLLLASRLHRTKQWISLHNHETANPDILRLLEYYRTKSLTDFDRCMLAVIARGKLNDA